jgi:hypothetical protein
VLDFPQFGQSLWSLYAQTGIRPEYILPVLALESNFNPAIVNSIGCTGIFQLCQNIPAGFASWSASQQMNGYGIVMYRGDVQRFGPLRSATRVYQANILPSTLATATTLDSVIARRGSSAIIPNSHPPLSEGAVYAANSGLDANHDGEITVGDLATKMRQYLARSDVQSAITQTYALQPGQSPVADPVFGDDFPAPAAPPGRWTRTDTALVVATVAAVGVAALVAAGALDRPVRAIRRAFA